MARLGVFIFNVNAANVLTATLTLERCVGTSLLIYLGRCNRLALSLSSKVIYT